MSTIEVETTEGEMLDQRFFQDETIAQIIRKVTGSGRHVILTALTEPRMVPYMSPWTWTQEFRICKLWDIQFVFDDGHPTVYNAMEIPASDKVYTMQEVVQYTKNRVHQ